jgi:hypothetical protein
MQSPEEHNYEAIERLEALLEELRSDSSSGRETDAMREVGFEIALAIREVGAMLINVGWEQTYAASRRPAGSDPSNGP